MINVEDMAKKHIKHFIYCTVNMFVDENPKCKCDYEYRLMRLVEDIRKAQTEAVETNRESKI